MSVINQMLLDLEKRRAGASEGAALPNQVRPLPATAPVEWRNLALVVAAVVIVLAVAALWWMARNTPGASLPAPVSSPTAQVSPPAPAPTLPPPAVLEAPKPALPANPRPAVATQKPATEKAVNSDAKQLRMAPATNQAAKAPALGTRVAAQPGAPIVATAVPQPAPPAAVQPVSQTASQPVSQPVANPEAAPKARVDLAPGKITKQDRPTSPRERAETEYRRATAALSQGRTDEAEEALRAALNEDPAFDAARQTFVGMLVEQKRVDEAKKLLQDYLTAKPSHLAFAMLLARLQIDRGDNTGAVATLSRTLPYAADNADFLGFAAALMQRAGRNAEAIEEYRAALRLRPDSAVWWMGLGISLQANEQKNDALDAYKRAQSGGALSPELQAFVEQRIKQVSP